MNQDTRVQKWKALLAEQATSGLSKKAFCEREGINAATFYYWHRRLAGHVPDEGAGFLRIRPRAAHEPRAAHGPRAAHEVVVCLAGQELRLRSGSPATLAQIIQHLDHA